MRPYSVTHVRPKISLRGKRLTASTFILLAAIFLAVSMGSSWWGAAESGGGHAVVIGFLPGSNYRTQVGSNLSNPSYIAAGLVHVGQLYEAVLAAGLLATLAAFVATILSYVGAVGGFASRRYLSVTLISSLVALIGAAALPGVVAGAQPGAFSADSTSGFGGATCGASPNPCTSFWNTISTTGLTVSWGADVGWYLAIGAAILLLVGIILLWTTRWLPYTRDELRGPQ